MREALANALCHRDYATPGGAVSVAMYDDHLEIVNPGALRFGITPEMLAVPHESRPWNPIVANVFYRAGLIERWGSGTLNIIMWCAENGNAAPEWQEQPGSVSIVFTPAALLRGTGQGTVEQGRDDRVRERTFTTEVTAEVTTEVTTEVRLLSAFVGEMSRKDLQSALGLSNEEHFRKSYIVPALRDGLIEMTVPGKPQSRMQKYRLTAKGRQMLEAQKGDEARLDESTP